MERGRGTARVHPQDERAKSLDSIPDAEVEGLDNAGGGRLQSGASGLAAARQLAFGVDALVMPIRRVRVPLAAMNVTLPRKKGWALLESWWVIDPRKTSWVAFWDLATTLSLIFTAIVTPVEVS